MELIEDVDDGLPFFPLINLPGDESYSSTSASAGAAAPGERSSPKRKVSKEELALVSNSPLDITSSQESPLGL